MSLAVLHVLSEYFPLIKTGGLGDVGAALPAALRRAGVDARVLLPGYPKVLEDLDDAEVVWSDANLFHCGPARLLRGELRVDGAPAYVVDAPGLYLRDGGPYQDASGADHHDNHLRFAALCSLGAQLCAGLDPSFSPDVGHAHDWPAGLLPAYVALYFGRQTPTVQTIHNVGYVGGFDRYHLGGMNLPESSFDVDGVEFHGRVSLLKAGLYYADHITTVSPTYAEELTRAPYGGGFEGLLATRRDQLTGILNGVDYAEWSPEHDPHLPAAYSSTSLEGKATCRAALCEAFGLSVAPGVPVIGMVSRLAWQKGIELLIDAARPMLAEGRIRLAVLGSGDAHLEDGLRQLAHEHPGCAGFIGRYDESLSHLVQGGADAFVMPSRTEPCGLTQLYALRYGTVPIVRRTGGLADTVTNTTSTSLRAGKATGFIFDDATVDALRSALERAALLYAHPVGWRAVMRTGMAKDFSWRRSSARYLALYGDLLDARG